MSIKTGIKSSNGNGEIEILTDAFDREIGIVTPYTAIYVKKEDFADLAQAMIEYAMRNGLDQLEAKT